MRLLLLTVTLGGCAARMPPMSATIRPVPMTGPLPEPPTFRLGPGDQMEIGYYRKYDGVDGEYLLDVGDVLSIKVNEHPDLASEVVVRPDGRITAPLVGDVVVRGQSLSATTQQLRDLLGRRIESPDVMLNVVKPRAKLDEFFETLTVSGGVVRTVIVRPDGRLSLPLIGEVMVRGRTVAEVETDVAERFRRLLRYVDVTLNLKSSPRQRVAVLGEVQRPGLYPFEGMLTPLQAVALAGGFLPGAAPENVVVARWESPTDLARRNVALDARADPQSTHILEGEDIVFVPRSGIRNVNLFVEQYIRQVLPFSTTMGAFYDLRGQENR